jgi:hypothetical protein
LRRIASLEEFEDRIDTFTLVASEYGAQVAAFPELYNLQTLSLAPKLLAAREAIDAQKACPMRFEAFLADLSVRLRINIIGGRHVTRVASGAARNVAYAALCDGTQHRQEKARTTPSERTF